MFLKSGKLAYGGMMTALTVILLFLSGVLESCSLVCLAAAAFITGGVAERGKPADGLLTAVAAGLLGFFLLPNKLYLTTYTAFVVYVLVWEALSSVWQENNKKMVRWVVKGIVYHVLLTAALVSYEYLFGLQTLVQGTLLKRMVSLPVVLWLAVFVAAELVWIVFDRAYAAFRFQWQQFHQRADKI